MIRKAKFRDTRDILRVINTSNRDAYKPLVDEYYFKDPWLENEQLDREFVRMDFFCYSEDSVKDESKVMKNQIRDERKSVKEKEEILGVAALEIQGEGNAEIRWMYVLPGHQWKGIGTALLKHIEHIAREKGMSYLKVRTGMMAFWARSFYGKMGFQEIGIIQRPEGNIILYGKDLRKLRMKSNLKP